MDNYDDASRELCFGIFRKSYFCYTCFTNPVVFLGKVTRDLQYFKEFVVIYSLLHDSQG